MKKTIRYIKKAVFSVICFMLAMLLALSLYYKAFLSGDNRYHTEQYTEMSAACIADK